MTVADLGADLLATAAAALTAPPARQVVVAGVPTDPLEGEQLGVGFLRLFTGVPGQPAIGPGATCWGPLVAEFVVRLVRCFPTSTGRADTNPDTATTTAAALMDDAEALRAALRAWNPATADSSDDWWIGDVAAARPQGLAHSLQVVVHVAT